MKHTTLDELQKVAAVHSDEPRTPVLSRTARLERWADLLERDPLRHLNTLPGTEYEESVARNRMRIADSPISVAFGDPVFRMDGLKGDTYGDAKRFFDLTDWQLHEIVCHCHYGGKMTAGAAAGRVRGAIEGRPQSGFMAWVRNAMSG